ncbi:Membrane associated serine protease, rhomboid family [Cnuella takakiae]|uniref:Membrane associated serine protease, rhomboid family n=1 Tax=Cnuella takakiae TaxID=1302690 RepID=A0A1M5C588_9BACT|nr:rhomboid family intramembrane serine protease [Cnuella takakiae]OLY93636.1 rhomboid family intramembrane serine protease [Cnuella takakiae]SHF49875.1 Membrane associated serine protease, rhomboid family [Cnuella takakiae]
MFIPIGDDNRDRRITPYINYLLIATNILVFIFFQAFGRDIGFTYAFSTVPGEILSGADIITQSRIMEDPYTGQRFEMPGLQPTPIPVYFTLITSMFMHGGLAHLVGNLMYLVIFGDNLENVMGHRNYLLFYLLCGILAALAHVFATFFLGHNPLIPSLGASGAISGVLAGYMRLFPRRGIHVWIFFFIITVPAFLMVGLWFVFQLINGLGALGGQEAGGVAYAAHIGGFIVGFLLVKRFIKTQRVVQVPGSREYYR